MAITDHDYKSFMNLIISILRNYLAYKLFNNRIFKINLAVTYQCNYRCKTCNIWNIYKRNPELRKLELTLEEYRKLFSNARKDLWWLSLTGGEPFLRFDLGNIIKSAIGFLDDLKIISINSNGSLPHIIEKTLMNILDFRDKIGKKTMIFTVISLDGPRRLHDYLRGYTGAYENSVKTFYKLKKLKEKYDLFDVRFEATVSGLNYEYFRYFLANICERNEFININDFTLTFVQSFEYYGISKEKYHDIHLSNEGINSIIDFFLKYYKIKSPMDLIQYSFLNLAKKYYRCNGKSWKPPCMAASGSVLLDPWGNVFPCIGISFNLGNIREYDYDLKKLLPNRKSNHFRKNILTKCAGCWIPCEAYQTILYNPTLILRSLFKPILI